ncbi:MAG: filamentous hemagglutinin N-terminal domain-containing protein, partial [Pseudomonadota bacterium]
RHHRRFALRDTVRHTLMVAAALQAAFGSGGLHALPTGGQVVIPGSAQIGAPVNNALTVTNAPGAIINWQSFSIAPNELVRFVQQNAASAVLNRVTGSQMSEIMGRLQSNGRVFLVNPNGIVVGPGAVIDTAAFIGSTLPMLDRDFIDGRLRFQGDASSNGRIVNQGSIRTGFGGQVMLVSPNIENTGLIEAPGGQILLAAGKSVTITSLNASGVSFELQAPTDSVVNIGQLLADGGVVRAFAGSLRHSGDIRANALVRDAGGQIVLQGSRETTLAAGSSTRADGRTGGSVQVDSAGATRVEGSVSATGSTGNGGRVEITGDRVVLAGTATADASGATGGGSVLVGGDWQGGNAAVRNATSTFVGSGVTLKADATVNGDGGTIVAWADGNTRFLGTLSARGGAQGGDGGRAEVSGRGELLFIGGADLGAPNGRFGSLLLDPLDLFIDTAGGLNPALIDESTDFPNNAVTVSPATLAAITGNVTLYASRDMRFNSNVTLTGAGQSLTAQAGRDLQLGSTLTTSNGAVSLNAGRSITTFGTPSIAAGTGAVSATAGTGSVTLGSVASAGSLTVNSNGNLSASTLNAAGPVVLSSASGSIDTGVITSGGGSVTLSSALSTSTSGITTAGGAISANAASGSVDLGTVSTIAGSGPAGGSLVVTAGGGTTYISSWAGGNGSATLSGRSVDTGTLNTTGDVSLTATAGSIYATIDNAASVTATSTNAVNNNEFNPSNAFEINNRYFSSNTSINLSSSTVLNATLVTATATSCSYYSCPGASITLFGTQGVNVGNVVASAPPTTTFAAPFNSISES